MKKSTIGIVVLSVLLIGMIIPAGFSAADNNIVVTYGETTHANSNYKSTVDNFFKTQANVDLKNVDTKIITADEVNKVASSITGKTYSSSEIYSSALVKIKNSGNIEVSVDKSKITTITADMYMSALKSAGIKQGQVYVTSPVTATGESALTGIMNCYEEATNVKIPENVKEVANKEIYVQSEIVENSNVSADNVSKLVDDVKETVQKENVTDHNTIVNIIYNYTVTNNINITNSDIENLANTIEQLQSVQNEKNNYESEVSDAINSTESNDNILSGIFN